MNNNHPNIDKKLQDLENHSSPDLGQMENHWQQMKTVLISSPGPGLSGKGLMRSPFRLFTLFGVVGLASIIFYKFNSTPAGPTYKNTPPVSIAKTLPDQDTIPVTKKLGNPSTKKSVAVQKKYPTKIMDAKDTTINYSYKKSKYARPANAVAPKKSVNRKTARVSNAESYRPIQRVNKKNEPDTFNIYAVDNKSDTVRFYAVNKKDDNETLEFDSIYPVNKNLVTAVVQKTATTRVTISALPIKRKNNMSDSILFQPKKKNTHINKSNNKNYNTNESIDSSGIILLPDSNRFSSLEDVLTLPHFKNKVVYVDLWGTRCGPCIKEFAHLAALKERYKGRPVAFLYLKSPYGFDDSEEWKDMVYQYQLEGVNVSMSIRFYSDNFWKKYAENYTEDRLYGIPTYLIINKNGVIVNYDAPRPSNSSSLFPLIEKFL